MLGRWTTCNIAVRCLKMQYHLTNRYQRHGGQRIIWNINFTVVRAQKINFQFYRFDKDLIEDYSRLGISATSRISIIRNENSVRGTMNSEVGIVSFWGIMLLITAQSEISVLKSPVAQWASTTVKICRETLVRNPVLQNKFLLQIAFCIK